MFLEDKIQLSIPGTGDNFSQRTQVKKSDDSFQNVFFIFQRASYLKINGLLQQYPTIFRKIFEKNSALISEIFPKNTQISALKMQVDDSLCFMSQYTRNFIASTELSNILQVGFNYFCAPNDKMHR